MAGPFVHPRPDAGSMRLRDQAVFAETAGRRRSAQLPAFLSFHEIRRAERRGQCHTRLYFHRRNSLRRKAGSPFIAIKRGGRKRRLPKEIQKKKAGRVRAAGVTFRRRVPLRRARSRLVFPHHPFARTALFSRRKRRSSHPSPLRGVWDKSRRKRCGHRP